MTRRPSFRPTTVSKVVLVVMASLLCATATPAAMETVAWATGTGSSPAHFENHEMGCDDVSGPNQSYAVGRWSGSVRHGSYSGFNLPTQGWVPTMVQLTLVGYVTGMLQSEYLRVTLVTSSGKHGPVTLGAASLNKNVSASGAGTWVMDFSSFSTFPAGALQGVVDVEIKLMSQGPSGGHELHLEAVGMMVRLEDPNQSFDLWLGDHAPVLAGGPSYLQGVGAPLDLGDNDCAGPICYLLVRDEAGAGRTGLSPPARRWNDIPGGLRGWPAGYAGGCGAEPGGGAGHGVCRQCQPGAGGGHPS